MAESVWKLVGRTASNLGRVLLWGPPGTGKSYLAKSAGLPAGRKPYIVPCTEETASAEIRGFFQPEGDRFVWVDGPGTKAMREGTRLVVNDIHRASDDLVSYLFAVADSDASQGISLPTGEFVTPEPGFSVWVTSNESPEALPEGITDRFVVAPMVGEPNPDAIAALPDDLQGIGRTLAVHSDPDRRIPLRALVEFAGLRDRVGAGDAATLCFGVRGSEILEALQLAEVRE